MSDFTFSDSAIKIITQTIKEYPFRPLNKIIYDTLYQEILIGNLSVDQQLVESKLAGSLGLSRSPIRLALQEMITNGILVKEHGNIHVKVITYSDALMLYEARMAIEPKVAYIVANRITDEELESLKRIVDCFIEIDHSKNEQAYIRADEQFHKMVILFSKNNYLINIYRTLEFPLSCYRNQVRHLNYDKMTESLGIERGSYHHAHIYDMLKLRAPLLAEDAMRNDIKRMYATLSKIEW